MQNSQLVSVRREHWRVVDVRPYDRCRLVTLSSVTAHRAGVIRHVLTPFDDVAPLARRTRPRVVTLSVWRRAFRDLARGDSPPGTLRTGVGARFDLLAHQLEPALAVVGGLGSRLLLGDEVGLGKTIQAALVISELRARGMADRVLVLTPAGLREQWVRELSERFDLQPTLVDAASVRHLAATLPVGTNPWLTTSLAVVSIDYVKRAEVLPAVCECQWDVVVVDEAHGVAGLSDRHTAVHALASRAAYVIALTATPHSGDRSAFVSLCGLGAHEDELLVFRRTRADVHSIVDRRTHTLRIRLSGAERLMHTLLHNFGKAVADEHPDSALALAVLHKRALSSPWSLEQSVVRRLSVLSTRDQAPGHSNALDENGQLSLAFDDPDGELTAVDAPPEWPNDAKLSDSTRERQLLTALAAAARGAVSNEAKLNALRRLIRRAKESVVVFTEYRDTLEHVRRALEGRGTILVLHGGLSTADRRAVLDTFTKTPRAVLLATDAASEGLNLHHRCRLVVNLELPWNPVRLEQRVGRVDRIGQERTVHAFRLIAANTAETNILDRLNVRSSRARVDLGEHDGAWESDEEPERTNEELLRPDLRTAALSEATRLATLRALGDRLGRVDRSRARTRAAPAADGPWLAFAQTRLRKTYRTSGDKVLLIWRIECVDKTGRAWDRLILGTEIQLCARSDLPSSKKTKRQWIDSLIEAVDDQVRERLTVASGRWENEARKATESLTQVRLARERRIAANCSSSAPPPLQTGLFDRRAERERESAHVARTELLRDIVDRLTALESRAALSAQPAELLLVLVP